MRLKWDKPDADGLKGLTVLDVLEHPEFTVDCPACGRGADAEATSRQSYLGGTFYTRTRYHCFSCGHVFTKKRGRT